MADAGACYGCESREQSILFRSRFHQESGRWSRSVRLSQPCGVHQSGLRCCRQSPRNCALFESLPADIGSLLRAFSVTLALVEERLAIGFLPFGALVLLLPVRQKF